jgi:AraC-like DNA-binding protein
MDRPKTQAARAMMSHRTNERKGDRPSDARSGLAHRENLSGFDVRPLATQRGDNGFVRIGTDPGVDDRGDLSDDAALQVRKASVHRMRLLRRACEAIDATLAERITMPELCSIVGASRRCLEATFLSLLGVPPYQYVRRRRLEKIRRELLARENFGVSIGDIAARYGIWHLSRFAKDYKRVFGQLPSESRQLLADHRSGRSVGNRLLSQGD